MIWLIACWIWELLEILGGLYFFYPVYAALVSIPYMTANYMKKKLNRNMAREEENALRNGLMHRSEYKRTIEFTGSISLLALCPSSYLAAQISDLPKDYIGHLIISAGIGLCGLSDYVMRADVDTPYSKSQIPGFINNLRNNFGNRLSPEPSICRKNHALENHV
jgi:hypothetical protein